MKISLGIYPNRSPAEIIVTGRLADDLGFSTLWMLDSHLLFREVYTLLGALAVSTKRIRLGTGVTNPLTRHPTVTASAIATLDALSAGRATLGISVGDSALKAMNLEIAKVSTLAETVRQCRALLAGSEVSFGQHKIAKLHHTGLPVPIYVAATGPRMLKLSGEIADGVILMNGVTPQLIQVAIDIVRDGERAAGRKEGTTKIVVWAACHPDPNAVRFNVARAILRKIPGPVDALTHQVAEEVHKAYTYQQHGSAEAEFAHLIPDELIPRFTFSGSSTVIAAQIDAIDRLGVDETILAIPFAPGIASCDEVMRQLGPALLGNRKAEAMRGT